MSVYGETTAALRAQAARAGQTEDVLFCEQRPLTSLEAQFAGVTRLAEQLREIEDDALRALKRLVDAEQGYETALRSIEDAGPDASAWLRAVLLARSLETLS
jgi:phosphoribosyl-dephospho-CoA transferase